MEIIEEIKRLKLLLDQGAITLEEFNSLKNNTIHKVTTNPSKESILNNTQESPNKEQFSFFKKSILFSAIILISTLVVLGIQNFASINQRFAGLIRRSNTMNDNNETTQNGTENDKIVTRTYHSSSFWPGGHEQEPLDIPNGKMWTFLYLKINKGNPNRINYFRMYNGNLCIEPNLYRSYDEYVSIKVSKQQRPAFTNMNKPGVTFEASNPSTITVYFFEESID